MSKLLILPFELKELILCSSALALKDLIQFALTSKNSYHLLVDIHKDTSILNSINVKLDANEENINHLLQIKISHQSFENPLYKFNLFFEINCEGLYVYFQTLVDCIHKKLNISLYIHDYYETDDIPSFLQIEIKHISNKSYCIFRTFKDKNNFLEYTIDCKNCLLSFSKLVSYAESRLEKEYNQNIKDMYRVDIKDILKQAK